MNHGVLNIFLFNIVRTNYVFNMDHEKKFNVGDLVAIAGVTYDKSGIVKRHVTCGKVAAVGLSDLVVIPGNETKYKSSFVVPMSQCSIIKWEKFDFNTLPRAPGLGDLVLSYNQSMSKVEKHIGVLVEIGGVPGKLKMAKILEGDKTIAVTFRDLIVLESAG